MDTFLHQQSAQKKCILCGRCLEVCPLLTVSGREELGPRAKHQLADSVDTQRAPAVGVKKLAALCLSCGKCEAVCPQGLCAPDVAAGMRAAVPGLQEWLWKNWMQKADILWPALARLAPALPENARSRQCRALRPPKGMTPWLSPAGRERRTPGSQPVVLFPGCLASHVRGDWIHKAGHLLALQQETLLQTPLWSCCGCTLGHAGLVREQRTAREQNITAWREAGRPRVAVFCATCRCGLRAYARDSSLPWEPGEDLQWQQSVVSLSELLFDLPFAVLENAPARVHYHRPCHGAGLKTGKGADQVFLEGILGERLQVPREKPCCGMGGILQVGAPALSAAVGEHCWSVYEVSPGEQVLTGCSGCVLQLAATTPAGVKAGHWLDAIAL